MDQLTSHAAASRNARAVRRIVTRHRPSCGANGRSARVTVGVATSAPTGAMSRDAQPWTNVSVTRQGSSTLVDLRGELDVFDALNFGRVRDEALRVSPPSVIIRAGDVRFVDCAFLGAIVALHDDCCARGGTCRIVDAAPSLRRVCELCGIENLVDRHAPVG